MCATLFFCALVGSVKFVCARGGLFACHEGNTLRELGSAFRRGQGVQQVANVDRVVARAEPQYRQCGCSGVVIFEEWSVSFVVVVGGAAAATAAAVLLCAAPRCSVWDARRKQSKGACARCGCCARRNHMTRSKNKKRARGRKPEASPSYLLHLYELRVYSVSLVQVELLCVGSFE